MQFEYKIVVNSLLGNVSERSKKIISRRFALGKKKIETLEKIGNDYGITRERVRQIELDGIKKIKKNLLKSSDALKEFQEIEEFFVKKINESGSIKREDLFLQSLGKDGEINYILFLLNLSEQFERVKESKDFEAYFILKNTENKLKEVITLLIKQLKVEKKPLDLNELNKEVKIRSNLLESYTEISKNILKTIDSKKFGLINWPEVNPRTVRDKIYFILKDNETPLHYKDIAKNISELNKGLTAKSVSKNLHPQTVHNELIRNENFVLIGRGIYALKEWGYNEGQVKDVILEILKGASNSLSREEVITLVSKKRIVRDSTVLLNLQNKKIFTKDESGKYKIREA